MVDEWHVFDLFDYVGVLSYDDETKQFKLEQIGTTERAHKAVRKLNADKDQKWFRETLFNRIFPPDRIDADEILRDIGLEKYDAWEILKIGKLVGPNDLIWMSKDKDHPEDFYETHWMASIIRKRLEEEQSTE